LPTFAQAGNAVAKLVQRFRLHTTERERDKELLQRHPLWPKLLRTATEATDRKIDRLVHELYAVRQKGIRIVEEATL